MRADRIAAWFAVPARWYLGVLFVGACLHKIIEPHAFAVDIATYDLLPLVLVNLGEGQPAPDVAFDHKHAAVVNLQGKLEMEIIQLPEADAQVFIAEYGIQELGLERIIRESYDLLGLQSFFTIGDDEGTAEAMESIGTTHVHTTHGEVVVDKEHRVVTTPCYMLDANILQIAEGADNIVSAMLKVI